MPNGDELKMDAKETASEDNPQARGVRKLRGRVIAAVVIAVAAVIAAASYWYVSYQIPHNNAVAEFETAVEALNDKNEELDSAISDLQDLMGSGEQPLDSSTLDAASAAIGVAQAGKETAPDMPEETEEIIAAASEVDEMGDYSDLIEALVSAQTNGNALRGVYKDPCEW